LQNLCTGSHSDEDGIGETIKTKGHKSAQGMSKDKKGGLGFGVVVGWGVVGGVGFFWGGFLGKLAECENGPNRIPKTQKDKQPKKKKSKAARWTKGKRIQWTGKLGGGDRRKKIVKLGNHCREGGTGASEGEGGKAQEWRVKNPQGDNLKTCR